MITIEQGIVNYFFEKEEDAMEAYNRIYNFMQNQQKTVLSFNPFDLEKQEKLVLFFPIVGEDYFCTLEHSKFNNGFKIDARKLLSNLSNKLNKNCVIELT